MGVTLFRTMGHLARNIIVANALGALVMLAVVMLGGFLLTKHQMHPWWCVPKILPERLHWWWPNVYARHSMMYLVAGMMLLHLSGMNICGQPDRSENMLITR